jgi:hypothetical protein
LPTKIQIPTSGNAPNTHLKKGDQCFWASNGHNTYNISLPANSFVEHPSGGTIQAANGGNSQTVTLMQLAAGTVVHCSFAKVTSMAMSSTGVSAQDSTSTQSGQSDIFIDP